MNITLDKGHITPLPVHLPPTYNFKWHRLLTDLVVCLVGFFPWASLIIFSCGSSIVDVDIERSFWSSVWRNSSTSFTTLDPIRHKGTCTASLDLSVGLKFRHLIFFRTADWSLCFTNHVACIWTKQYNSTTIWTNSTTLSFFFLSYHYLHF